MTAISKLHQSIPPTVAVTVVRIISMVKAAAEAIPSPEWSQIDPTSGQEAPMVVK